MTVAQALQTDVQRLYERVTGSPFPVDRFRGVRAPLPPQVEPETFLRDKLEQLHRITELRLNQGQAPEEGTWVPVAEVWDTEDQFEIQLDLPGVSKKQVDVRVGDHVIQVSGERKKDHSTDAKVVTCEKVYGPFQRWIALPFPVDSKGVKTEFVNGVLRILVTKKSPSSLERIEVR